MVGRLYAEAGKKARRNGKRPSAFRILALGLFMLLFMGCAMGTGSRTTGEREAGTIRRGSTGAPVSFEEMMDEASASRVVYVGEQHTHPVHHDIQLKVIQDLHRRDPDLAVGMEMFPYTYQPVLDRWSAGALSETAFLKQTHWYANWKFDFDLYREILTYIREHRIRLVGLNIPFHIPALIAVGGLSNLPPDDAKHIPGQIRTDDPEHRAYLKGVYEKHKPMLRGRDDFEDFYMAQNVWEDAMAEAVAGNLDGGRMAVLVGNGHIIKRYGIPDRAYARTGAPYTTILPTPDPPEDPDAADYIWVTPPLKRPPFRGMPPSE